MSDSEDAGPSRVSSTQVPAAPYPMCRLTDNNYQAWAIKTEMALKRESLWTCVSDPPSVPRSADRLRDERAQALIVLSMDDDLLVHVRGLTTAKQCWDALKDIYVRESVASKIALSRRLYRARLEPGNNLKDHLRRMQQYIKDLEEKGVTIPEFQKALTVLSSLDSSWDVFALTLETVPEQVLTLPYLTGRLLEEEEKRQENAAHRGKNNSRTTVPRQVKAGEEEATQVHAIRRRCFRCKDETHLAKDCDARKSMRKGKKYGPKYQVSMVQTQPAHNGSWLVDSGSNHDIAFDPELFISLQSSPRDHVSLANGNIEKVIGKGKIFVPGLGVMLTDVLCVPTLKQNLLSVASLVKLGYTVTFKGGMCEIIGRGNNIRVPEKDSIYMLDGISKGKAAQVHFTNKDEHGSCQHLWHRRLAHSNFKYVQRTIDNARGAIVKDCHQYLPCQPCAVAKTRRAPVSKQSLRQSKQILELVHMDLTGPVRPTMGGARYVFLLIDDYSRFSYCYLLKEKSQVFEQLKKWVSLVERRFNKQVICLQSDRGGEFVNKAMSAWLGKKGIMHKRTNPYTPQENGIAERRLAWIQNVKDCLLADSGLGHALWGEAILTSNFLVNRIWSESIRSIPYTIFYGKSPDLSFLRCFGSKAFVNIPKEKRRKCQFRAQKLTMVGYEPLTKGYRFLAPDKRSIIISRSAKFFENEPGNKEQSQEFFLPVPIETDEDCPVKGPEQRGAEQRHQLTPDRPESVVKQETTSPLQSGTVPSPQGRTFSRTTRGIPPERLVVGCMAKMCSDEPQSFKDLENLPHSEKIKWQKAMEEEMTAMKNLNVFTDCDLPVGQKAIGCRWVFRIKPQEEGQEPVYRARLVAQGFAQEKYTHYTEIFSPTLAATSIRILFTLAAHKGWKIYHFDVKTAYLNAELQEVVYMCQPPGYDSKNGSQKVWKLKKALYGLKQSAREWNKTFDNTVRQLGFHPLKADPCVYTMGSGNSQIVMSNFVDDVLILCLNEKQAQKVAQQLEKSFKLRFLGEVKHYLGIEIEKTEQGFALSQSQKILQLLERWMMNSCKASKTPMEAECGKVKPIMNVPVDQLCDVDQYKSLLGSLLHIALWTRPDICFAVNKLSRQASNPSQADWIGLKRILRYLKGTVDYKLRLYPEGPLLLECFADSDWASSDDRKSTSGIVVLLGKALVDWKSKKQSVIALSSCESEYASLSYLITELIWHRQMLKDLDIEQSGPVVVKEDNESCIQLAESERTHGRSKHIDIRYQNVKTTVQNQEIELVYCPSEENVADILTKALPRIRYERGVELLRLQC